MKNVPLFLLILLFLLPACSAAEAPPVSPAPSASLPAETGSVVPEDNPYILGTYRKLDSGVTPVILFFDGSGAKSKNAALLRFADLDGYNLFCFNSTSRDIRSFDIANYPDTETLKAQYADVVIREVLLIFPDAEKIGIVSYSNGGYAAGTVCMSAIENGLTVCWVAGYDNVVRAEKRYLAATEFIRENGIPALLAVSTDLQRPITRNSIAELDENWADYAWTGVYDARHGTLMDADGVSRDLAAFAARYFQD